jgi:hypothetical protein
VTRSIAVFAGETNLSMNLAASPQMTKFVCDLVETGMKIGAACPSFNPHTDLALVSRITLAMVMKAEAEYIYRKKVTKIANDIHFLNLSVDAGTVLQFKTVHAVLTNPNFPEVIIPFANYKNHNFTAKDYQLVFANILAETYEQNIEICGVQIENLPAQAKGLTKALSSPANVQNGAIHIPCLNHGTNLVFGAVVEDPRWHPLIERMCKLISLLRVEDAVHFLGGKCPGIIRTRWIYAAETLRWIFSRLDDINAYLISIVLEIIPRQFFHLYWAILPLEVFSLSMESAERKLSDVIPIMFVIQGHFRRVNKMIEEEEGDVSLIDYVTAHFYARMKANNFGQILTA